MEAGLRSPPTGGGGGGTQPLITLSFSTAFSTVQARKAFRDDFNQGSGDKGRVEQTQQQKVSREPA